jgi:NAD(P)-dependent dehydrogenase (short-subunit alcohol dehydrogenase family)
MPSEKIALVTGANKGIGFATARRLGELGATVLLGARDEARGKQAAGLLATQDVAVIPLRIDVTDRSSIADAAERIRREYGRLDVLINNAGIGGGFHGPPSEATVEQMRKVYETNVFGVVAVTNAMLPLLRRSAAGRIVNMSSDIGSLTLNADPSFAGPNLMTYQSSKTSLNAVTVAYARELRESGIKVNAANPGLVATDINGHRGTRTPEQGAVIAVRLATLGADGPTGTCQDEDGVVPW